MHNKFFFTIISKYFSLLAKDAFGKKGNNPHAYRPKLSINLASFLDIILCKITL